MNKYKNKTLYRLNPIKATVSDFSLCVWCFNNIKGIIHPKIKNSVIFIASFTHSKVVLNLNEFHSSAKHKVSFEEGGKTKQLLVHSDFHSIFFPTIKVNVDHQLFDYPDSPKYLLLCSAQERN